MIRTLFMVFTLLSCINVRATLDKSGHLMLITYDINAPDRSQGVVKVDILFHWKGKLYKVASHRYPVPVVSISDTFPWFSRSEWEGGDLEVVFYKVNRGKVERYISEREIEVRDLGFPPMSEDEYFVDLSKVKEYEGPDPYAWRMLGYDAGHTGYYPFPLYPPLEFKWILETWGHPGSWITDVSGAAGHGMLFIPKSASQWNILTARDIETGEVIWQRYVTANAMTSALSEGDSVLFVGTVIGFTPSKDTTFYAFDPFTGEVKWGMAFKTVQQSPIVVDSLVYVPSYGLSKIFCVTYRGDTLWSSQAGFPSPVYSDGIIVHTVFDSVLDARNYLTGELMWDFTGSGRISNLLSYESKVIFSPGTNEPLYAFDLQNGHMLWSYWEYINGPPLNGFYSRIYWGYGAYMGDTMYTILCAINSFNGQFIWDTVLEPADTNKGRIARIVATQDTFLWFTNCGRIYVLKNFSKVYEIDLPPSLAVFPGHHFPIAYHDKFIYAHEDYLVVYEADTVDTSWGQDTLLNFALYSFTLEGKNYLKLILPEEGSVSLSLYTVSGARIWGFKTFLNKGEYTLPLPTFPSGVYLLRYALPNYGGVQKILLIKNRR